MSIKANDSGQVVVSGVPGILALLAIGGAATWLVRLIVRRVSGLAKKARAR